ncbi:MAG: hypothetical protein PHO46_11870 [Thermoguttaceae bacterium]|nr:hypothetical protein [Thermoguttaceae bacterium]
MGRKKIWVSDLNGMPSRHIRTKTVERLKDLKEKGRDDVCVLFCWLDCCETLRIELRYKTESDFRRTSREIDDPREARWFCSCVYTEARRPYSFGEEDEHLDPMAAELRRHVGGRASRACGRERRPRLRRLLQPEKGALRDDPEAA